MGIKNLKVILIQKCSNAINTRKLDCYRGMTVGIDLSIFLYKYLYNNDDHIEGLTRLLLRLLKNQITPIFVFDGKPPKEKDDTLSQRKEKKEILLLKRDILDSVTDTDKVDYDVFKTNVLNVIAASNNTSYEMAEEEMRDLFEKSNEDVKRDSEKLTKKIIYVTQYHIDSSKRLFDLCGIKYIHEQCEAESLIAYMCKNNYIDACISEDTDILANGGYLFLRNFSADKNTVDEYCLQGILDGLQLDHDKFIDLCILCGCDYTGKIHGLGPINAHKLLLKYGSIEEIIKHNTKYEIPANFDYQTARELFKNPISDELFANIDKNSCINQPQINELLDFLKETKLKDKYVTEIKNNLMNYYLNIKGLYDIETVNSLLQPSTNKTKNNKIKSKKITDFWN